MYDKLYRNEPEKLLAKVINNSNAKNIKIIRKLYLNQKIKFNKDCEGIKNLAVFIV